MIIQQKLLPQSSSQPLPPKREEPLPHTQDKIKIIQIILQQLLCSCWHPQCVEVKSPISEPPDKNHLWYIL